MTKEAKEETMKETTEETKEQKKDEGQKEKDDKGYEKKGTTQKYYSRSHTSRSIYLCPLTCQI